MSETNLAAVDSREKAEAMHRAGTLGKLLMRPLELGGEDLPINTLYVPAAIIRRKSEIDLQVIQPLAEKGLITKYEATTTYQGKSVVPTTITITVSDPTSYRFVLNIWGDPLENELKQWDEVYTRREAIYAQHFGIVSGDVQKLMNLIGVWPGGCLVQIESPKHQLWVTSSFGLTNADMPARFRSDSSARTMPDGNPRYESNLMSRPPGRIPLGRAGYGYEILLFTRQKEFWPLMFLNWAVPMEILRDVDLLGRMEKYGAMTIESVSLGDGKSSDFLIAPFRQFNLPKLELPNGQMELLIATAISRPEMEFGVKSGGPALLQQILARPQKQISMIEG